jgi:hypothetical protein
LDRQLVVGECVLDAGLLACEDCSGYFEEGVSGERAWCAGRERGGLAWVGDDLASEVP